MPKITFTISQENLDTLNAHLEEGREVSPEKTFTLGGAIMAFIHLGLEGVLKEDSWQETLAYEVGTALEACEVQDD